MRAYEIMEPADEPIERIVAKRPSGVGVVIDAASLPEPYRSAPDLLAALKGVVAVADRQTVEFDAARAAIAKAEAAE